ncbi:MAG TPA: tRNA (adenosine(37)-N6)-threonylcarbamoyltransferase complex dimerization subunit type 1 TsaB, partial [Syntrophales bacterium]|nr:tRNA (adenosine(37)-N6)-threonylcarbamoyltransferase complex dimerization subunit type 1 TsaB [Syntrophales bacterium]
MNILALDTSGTSAGIALVRDEVTLGEVFLALERHHSEILLPAVDQLLRVTGVRMKDLDLFACTVGPGSFTGVRIGVSTVKGLALACDRPVAGVSTLEALAENAAGSPLPICPMLDAKRGQVYRGLYRSDAGGSLLNLVPDGVGAADEILAGIETDAVFIGNGTRVYRDKILARRNGKSYFAPPHLHRISAAAVGSIARRRAVAGDVLEAIQLAPVY